MGFWSIFIICVFAAISIETICSMTFKMYAVRKVKSLEEMIPTLKVIVKQSEETEDQ